MPIELILIVAIFLAFALWRFDDALTIVFFLLPAYQLRYVLFGIPITLVEICISILIVVWAFRIFRHRVNYIQGFHTIPWKIPIALFLLSAVIGVLVAADTQSALGYLKAYYVEPIIFFCIVLFSLRTESQLRRVYIAFGGMVIVIGVIAVLQYVNVLVSPLPWSAESPKRVTSLFEYPNAVGLYVAPIIALFLAFIGSQFRSLRWKLFTWLVIGMGLIAIFAANSRGAFLAVAAGAVLLLYVRLRKKILLTVILAVLVAGALIMPTSRGMIQSVVTGNDVSTDVRLVMWQGTAKLLVAHPFFGAGLGGFPALYDQYRLIKHVELLQYPHNIILNFWVELGLLGLIAVVWLFIVVFRDSAIRWAHTNTSFQQSVLLGVMLALVVIVVHGIVDVPYLKNDLALQFWVLLSLAAICGAGQGRQNQV